VQISAAFLVNGKNIARVDLKRLEEPAGFEHHQMVIGRQLGMFPERVDKTGPHGKIGGEMAVDDVPMKIIDAPVFQRFQIGAGGQPIDTHNGSGDLHRV